MVFSCDIYSLSFPSCEKRSLLSAGKGSQSTKYIRGVRETFTAQRQGLPSARCDVSLCVHRQGAGSLCHGPQPLSHAGLGLPDDLQEHDSGGRHRARVEAPLHPPKPGLPQAAQRTGHSAGTAKEEQQEQHHHLALPCHGCATGKETP